MVLPLKAFLGATCLTGTLAAGGVVGLGDDGGKVSTEAEVLAEDETSTTTTEVVTDQVVLDETTTATTLPPPPPPPPPPPAPVPPPIVLPAAEAGQVNVTINGDLVFVNGVNPLQGWTATVDREGDTIVVTFTRGDESVRVVADFLDGRLESKLERLAAARALWEAEHREFDWADWKRGDRDDDRDRERDGWRPGGDRDWRHRDGRDWDRDRR